MDYQAIINYPLGVLGIKTADHTLTHLDYLSAVNLQPRKRSWGNKRQNISAQNLVVTSRNKN